MNIREFTNEVNATLRKHARLSVEALARNTEAEAKKSILREAKSGRFYRVPGTRRTYQASAPGQSPAPRTGDLANSIRIEVESDYVVSVGSELKYSRIEFGYGRAAPRPYLRPANDKTMQNKDAIFSAVFRQVTR